MKKYMISLGLLFASTLVMAGGNVATNLSPIAEVSAQTCKENKIYIEGDVQLMWQDQAYSESEYGAYKRHKSIGKAGTHRHARAYCSRLNYAGYGDWRLPSSDELTHVHYKKGQVFTYFRDNDFWSSTPATEGKYYVVFPADTIRYARSPRQSNFVRCVRCTANDK